MSEEKPIDGAGPARAMQSDILHWSNPLECWATENAQGVLWVPKASFLREVNRVLAGYQVTDATATPLQFMDATAFVQDPTYWDTLDDPEVTRFPPGEVQHGSSQSE